MSRKKFTKILQFIRFDKRNERTEGLQNDKFAMVSEVWNRCIEKIQSSYKPGENITVDVQLSPTEAMCRFIQYKPAI